MPRHPHTQGQSESLHDKPAADAKSSKAGATRGPRTPAVGSVRADEILALREFGRRFGVGKNALIAMQKSGLRTAILSGKKVIVGQWLIDFLTGQV